MEIRYHRPPADLLRELAAGGGGVAAMRMLGGIQASRHLLLVRGVAETARASGDPRTAGRVEAAYEMLADLQAVHPEAVRQVICHPAVGAWAGRAIRDARLHRSYGGLERLSALAAAAAVRAGARATVSVPAPDGRLMLPSLGMAVLGPVSHATVRVASGQGLVEASGTRVAIPADPESDAPGWLGLRRLRVSSAGLTLDVLLDDLDPYRLPGMPVRGRLPEPELARWKDDLAAAWRILVLRHGPTAAEIGAGIRAVTPLTGPRTGQVSASSREAHGSLAFSTTGEARELALIMAHEVQHAKLAALIEAVPMIRPGHDRRYYAPWRDDPRPVYGLLQGAYAHLGVAGFWRRERRRRPGDMHAHTEFERWRTAALVASESLLDGDGLTPAGAGFAGGMLETLRLWGREPVPAPAMRLARRRAARHRALWLRRHGHHLAAPRNPG
ncbi:HEXXH motif-containing putative peptide modification protein [Spirillospora sp. NPDC048832]